MGCRSYLGKAYAVSPSVSFDAGVHAEPLARSARLAGGRRQRPGHLGRHRLALAGGFLADPAPLPLPGPGSRTTFSSTSSLRRLAAPAFLRPAWLLPLRPFSWLGLDHQTRLAPGVRTWPGNLAPGAHGHRPGHLLVPFLR